MIQRKFFVTAFGAAGVAALLLTGGCSAGQTDGEPAPASPSTSASATSATGPSGPSGPSGTAAATPSAAPDDGSPEPGATTTPAGDAPADAPRCLTPDLAGTLQAVEGGGSAGHTEVEIVLENEAGDPCVLQGWPGVSFVGDDDGTQIGAAATLDRSSPHEPVTLDPGSVARAAVSVANAQNFDEDCDPTPADGFRVYPPGEKRSLFVESDQVDLTACANPDDELLDVQAFQPVS